MSSRPSEIYNVEDEIAAFCFDRAVSIFGMSLEAELDSVKAKTDREVKSKRDQIFRRWIPEMSAGRRFKDPAKD